VSQRQVVNTQCGRRASARELNVVIAAVVESVLSLHNALLAATDIEREHQLPAHLQHIIDQPIDQSIDRSVCLTPDEPDRPDITKLKCKRK